MCVKGNAGDKRPDAVKEVAALFALLKAYPYARALLGGGKDKVPCAVLCPVHCVSLDGEVVHYARFCLCNFELLLRLWCWHTLAAVPNALGRDASAPPLAAAGWQRGGRPARRPFSRPFLEYLDVCWGARAPVAPLPSLVTVWGNVVFVALGVVKNLCDSTEVFAHLAVYSILCSSFCC